MFRSLSTSVEEFFSQFDWSPMRPSIMLLDACRNNSVRTVSTLLSLGLDPNFFEEHTNITPLQIAAEFDRKEILQLLLDNGADPNFFHVAQWPPLHAAVMSKELSTVKLLVERGARVDVVGKLGTTCLHVCAAKRSRVFEPICEYLLLHGADATQPNDFMETPLHFSAYQNQGKIAWMLLQHGADVNAINKYNTSPLHFAVKGNNVACARVLLACGADQRVRNQHGQTVHDLCRSKVMEEELARWPQGPSLAMLCLATLHRQRCLSSDFADSLQEAAQFLPSTILEYPPRRELENLSETGEVDFTYRFSRFGEVH